MSEGKWWQTEGGREARASMEKTDRLGEPLLKEKWHFGAKAGRGVEHHQRNQTVGLLSTPDHPS